MASQTHRVSVEEGAPLLSPTASAASLPLPPPPPKKKPWVLLVVLCLLLIAIVDMGAFLAEPPKTRVFEAKICLAYYRQHDPSAIGADGKIPEKLCKIDSVQQKLAMIFGWQDTFDALPGILLAVPFGTLADRIGRKWIFTASLMGLQLSFAWILVICRRSWVNSGSRVAWLTGCNRLFQDVAVAVDMAVFGILLHWRRADCGFSHRNQ